MRLRALLVPLLVTSALGLLPAVCHAQLPAASKDEIDALLRAVGRSGCEFLRGGSSHNAAEAQAHLQMKYGHLASRGQLKTAEDFIAQVATRSSMTGEAYGIRCRGLPPQPSAEWLAAQLRAVRQTVRTP